MANNIPSNIEETDFFKENANLVDFFNNSCAKHSEKIAFESFDVEMSLTSFLCKLIPLPHGSVKISSLETGLPL